MLFVDNQNTGPFFNLALEEYFQKRTDLHDDILILWRNEPTIVVGRHQDTANEIHEEYVKENHIQVVRRNSGGGAVYHDLGNLNFSVIQSADRTGGFEDFAAPVIRCLRGLGVEAEFNGRNDILVEGRKFSGNAQYIHRGRILHHGTILFSSDLQVLTQALNVSHRKIQSKGIPSVRSRVTNLAPYLQGMTIEDFRSKLADEILSGQNGVCYSITDTDVAVTMEIARVKYETHAWNYGEKRVWDRTGELQTSAGNLCLQVETDGNVIMDLSLLGDYFALKPVEELEQQLIGKSLQDDTWLPVDCSEYILGLHPEELHQLMQIVWR